MSDINDKATVNLFVNGEQAEEAMARLKQRAKDLTAALEETKNATNDKNAAKKALKYQRELDKINSEIRRIQSRLTGVGEVLNNLSNTSLHGLKNALKVLQSEVSKTKPGTERWKRYSVQIKEVKSRIAELSQELKNSESPWERFKQWSVGAWPALDLIRQGAGFAIGAMREYVDAFADMDQEMANTRKFTGMTADQVADLNEEFKKIDTRTSREGLNKLAQEAGRLGKSSKEDVLGFVRAADQLNVALDDLGDGATLTLSKLTGMFGDEARYGTEKSLLKVGSVINELSQNCKASAPYLANFASRISGVGAQAKMTIPQIMAFGAVLDSNGQQVEASATAVSQVIVRMMQEPAKYARVAGLDVKRFTEMLKTNVNGALIMFLETLQKAGGMDKLSPMFKDMGENGSRAIASLSTLATHIDDVKAQQLEANKAFREGTSVTAEFNVQNTTVQAKLEKAKKQFQELRVELGEKLAPLMGHVLTSTGAMARALSVLINFILKHKTAILSLAAGIATYTIAVQAVALKTAIAETATKAWTSALAALRVALITGKGVVALFTRNTIRASAAFKLLGKTMKANPIGLILSLLTSATVAIAGWINKVNAAKKAERELARQREEKARTFREQILNISKTAGDYAKTELDRLDRLYKATQDATKSQKERVAAINELQKTYPATFGNLTQEKILTGEASAAYDALTKSIRKAARAKAAAEKIQENEKMLLDLDLEREDLEQSIREDSEALESAMVHRKTLGKDLSNKYKLSLTGPTQREQKQLEGVNIAVQTLNDNLDASTERLEEIILQTGELEKANKALGDKAAMASGISPDVNLNGTPTVPDSTDTPRPESDKERRKREAEERREAAKAKKEFRDQLDAYKAQRSAADREVLELYKGGELTYEQLLERRHENEEQFYANSAALFERTFADQKDTYLQDDKDYQKLLLDREKANENYEKSRTALRLEAIARQQAADERDARHMHDVRTDPTLQDEIELQAKLHAIRLQALRDKQALYAEGSKEWADTQFEIEQLEQNREMDLKKLYFGKVAELRRQYDQKNAAERFTLEKAMLDALLKAGVLTAEQYERYLKGITQKYNADLPGDDKQPWSDNDQSKFASDVTALQDALDAQLLSQADFNTRMADLDDERRRHMFAGLKESGGEWNAMLAEVYLSFSHMLDGLDGTLESTLANVADCVGAVSSVVGAGLQIATEFAKAEAEVQLKAVESRYDREIELAQGNTYKVAKLEKKKEAETARIKNQATKKEYQMKIIQAVAQTIQGGLNAYASTLAIPIIGPELAPAAMAVALAMGTAQVALLRKQQAAAEAQGYMRGGFTRPGAVDEPAGIVHAGEWVASQKLLASPVARPMIEALDYAQRTNTIGTLRPEDVSRSIRANDSIARIAEDDNSAGLIAASASQTAQVLLALLDRLKEPFVTVNTVTGDHGIKQAQDEYTQLMKNVTPKSKRKK